MGNKNGDKHTKKEKKIVNVKFIEGLLYCLQLTNYLQT